MNNNKATVQRQSETLLEADKRGEPWTEAEIQLLLEQRDHRKLYEVATGLGRTYYGVMGKLFALARGGGNATTSRKPSKALPYDKGFTTWPEGYWD